MNRKGQWEGNGQQAKPVVSFPRTFSTRKRRLGTRQFMGLLSILASGVQVLENEAGWLPKTSALGNVEATLVALEVKA